MLSKETKSPFTVFIGLATTVFCLFHYHDYEAEVISKVAWNGHVMAKGETLLQHILRSCVCFMSLSSLPGSIPSIQTHTSQCTESVASSASSLTLTRWPLSVPRTQVWCPYPGPAGKSIAALVVSGDFEMCSCSWSCIIGTVKIEFSIDLSLPPSTVHAQRIDPGKNRPT